MRQLRYLVLLLILGAPSFASSAKGGTATQPISATTPAQQIILGNSVAVLDGPWKFHIGDNMAWAQPDFDDSGWQNYFVGPQHPALAALQAIQSGELPGWQQHGHPGYTGYAWYRIRVQPPREAESLSLLLYRFDDSFELYVDGRKIGSYGKLGSILGVYTNRPVIFRIPPDLLRNGQPLTLTIRFWNSRPEALPSGHNLSGGLRAVPIVGPEPVLQALQKYLPSPMYGALVTQLWLLLSLHGAVGIICLFLFLFSRSQREYLWTAVVLLGVAVEAALQIGMTTGSISVVLETCLFSLFEWVSGSSIPMAVMHLLQIPKNLWRRCTYVASGLLAAYLIAAALLSLGVLPPTIGSERVGGLIQIVTFIAFSLLILSIVVDGLRTLGRRAWLPLTPGVFVVGAFASALVSMVTSHGSSFGPAWLVCWLCFPLSILFVFLVRFSRQQRENAQMMGELEQARHIQSLLVPVKAPPTPGFAVESVYVPASEVGGDFFYLRPREDGSLLVVVGDVSGKGLKAAMTVSTIIGALRNEKSRRPAEILSNLNGVLHGQIKGFATCCACLIAADGTMTVANAGHIPPYRNGAELGIPGDVPLGILPDVKYEEHRVQLAVGDRLTFVSDGIVEAMNAKRELFGFERTQRISDQPAASVASAAQQFGQQDDITVLSVVFESAKAPAPQPLGMPAPIRPAESF